MRIDGPGSREVEPASRNADRTAVSLSAQVHDTAENSSLAVSPELQALRDKLGLLPDVRPSVVAEATRRLNSGELSNKESIAKTAEALLSTNVSPIDAQSAQLGAALVQIPLVRNEVVSEALRKLRTGELSTPDAIQRTASVLL